MSSEPHDTVTAGGRPDLSSEAFARTVADSGAAATAGADAPRPGRRVGHYRIVRELGHGGMGSVYLAVRDDDQYKKQVALKLLRGGLGTAEAVARFVDERQILAGLEHPGIVRMLDGGSTEDGLPFLVMEYVEGVPITEYCDTLKLSVRERLELFRRVCAAVQFAHQRLVVHRDIKPRNILVTADGSPKLLDFGIAKLLGDGPREAQTRTGVHVLTPEYGSPEQARGGPISVATDVYSLGAVLYELLTGTRAHRFPSESMVIILQTICETEPGRPSLVAPPARRRALAGDVDNIVLKALQKEPERRYATVEQLADDLRRHLKGLPVMARPNTWAYRAGKLLRRHRGAVAAATLLVLSLATAAAVSLRAAHRADQQARRADLQAQRADRRFNDVRHFASSLLFEVDGKIQNLAGATAARELIVSRALEYLDVLGGETERDPDLSYELAKSYIKIGDMQSHVRLPNLGRPRDAQVSYRKAIKILHELRASGRDEPRVRWTLAEALYAMGYLYRWEGLHALARTTLLEGMSLVEAMGQTADFNYPVEELGFFTLWAIDKEARALPAMREHSREALELAQAWAQRDPSPEARYWVGLGYGYRAFTAELSGDPDTAGQAYRDAIAVFEKLVVDVPESKSHPSDLAYGYWSLGRTLGGRGDPELWLPERGQRAEAEAAMRKSLTIAEELVKKDPQDARTTVRTAATAANLAAVVEARDAKEALALYDRSAAMYRGLPADVRDWSYARKSEWFLACSMAEPLARAGRRDEALAAIRRGRELVDPVARSAGASFRDRGAQLMCRAREVGAQLALGDKAAAAQVSDEVITGLRQLIAAQPEPITAYIGLVEALQLRAKLEPARRCELNRDALSVWRSWPGQATSYTQRRLAELEAATCPP